MRVAYVVSRFPHVSETFIVRELDAVSAAGEVEIELFSLFPAVAETVHPAAQPWVRRLQRATVGGGLAALVWWLVSSPASARLERRGRRPSVRSPPAPRAARDRERGDRLPAHARALAERPVDHVHAHYATYPALAAWLCRRLARRRLQLHRPRPRPLPRPVDARAQDRRRPVRGHDLGLQPRLAAPVRRRLRDPDRGRPLRDRPGGVRVSRPVAAGAGAGRRPLRRQPPGVQGSRGAAAGAGGRPAPRASPGRARRRGQVAGVARAPRGRARDRRPRRVHGRPAGGRGPGPPRGGRPVRPPEHHRLRWADGGAAGCPDGGDGFAACRSSRRGSAGIPELVVDGETGLLAEPGDAGGSGPRARPRARG